MKKILVIDDFVFSKIIIEELIRDKYKIFFLEDKGIDYIKSLNPDLILLDIIMPEKSGFDFLKEFDEELRKKTIVISSLPKEYAKKRALMLGAKLFIEKPFNIEYLKDLIDDEMAYIN